MAMVKCGPGADWLTDDKRRSSVPRPLQLLPQNGVVQPPKERLPEILRQTLHGWHRVRRRRELPHFEPSHAEFIQVKRQQGVRHRPPVPHPLLAFYLRSEEHT